MGCEHWPRGGGSLRPEGVQWGCKGPGSTLAMAKALLAPQPIPAMRATQHRPQLCAYKVSAQKMLAEFGK